MAAMKKAGAAAVKKGQKAAAAPEAAPARKSMKTGKAKKAAAAPDAAPAKEALVRGLKTKYLDLEARVKHLESRLAGLYSCEVKDIEERLTMIEKELEAKK